MSALRKSLSKPHFWLAVVLVLVGAAAADSCRHPARQLTARCYVRLVRAYQTACDPGLSRLVQCRYRPTCSEYSIQAVQRYGTVVGLGMTISRLWRCRTSVPLGTEDPVPPLESAKNAA